MGLLESVIGAAGAISFKVKNMLGVYDREVFKEDPLTPKGDIPPVKIEYGRKRFLGVTAQMNSINFETKQAVDKINAERNILDSQEVKIQNDLTNAKTDADRDGLNEKINSIENRRIELNQQESEVRSELKRVMDLIRSDFNLPEDCDASDPHWKV